MSSFSEDQPQPRTPEEEYALVRARILDDWLNEQTADVPDVESREAMKAALLQHVEWEFLGITSSVTPDPILTELFERVDQAQISILGPGRVAEIYEQSSRDAIDYLGVVIDDPTAGDRLFFDDYQIMRTEPRGLGELPDE